MTCPNGAISIEFDDSTRVIGLIDKLETYVDVSWTPLKNLGMKKKKFNWSTNSIVKNERVTSGSSSFSPILYVYLRLSKVQRRLLQENDISKMKEGKEIKGWKYSDIFISQLYKKLN